MEISKALQEDVLSVQNKLKNAIRDHQICVVKLEDDPNNTDILDQMREIQLHIVSLGRWQKQVVQRLRKEVETYKAENSLNGTKFSVASLLGLNNNNHITASDNEAARRVTAVPPASATAPERGINGHRHRDNDEEAKTTNESSKEDYEEVVRNGDVASPLREEDNSCRAVVKERRSSSAEPGSIAEEDEEEDEEDEEVVEVPQPAVVEEGVPPPPISNSVVEQQPVEEKVKPCPVMAREQQCFLGCLGLITNARLLELQNKRAERKRRSTANSHFVYSNWEVPMKRKRHAYLQSLGNAPQTRQTTARLNGPSPPPSSTKSNNNSIATRTTSTGNGRASTKSLIRPTTPPKTTSTPAVLPKPNILRNGDGKTSQKEVYGGKLIKQETDRTSIKVEPTTTTTLQPKLTPTTSTGKTVHIPGLPSCLTVERIENDSTVCITCRNPGTLTVCEYCSAKFHVSCHSTSPASSYYCPKCAARFRSKGLTSADLEILRLEMKSAKKDKETAAAGYASRAFGKAGEDPEVHKTSSGLYKADAAQTRQLLTAKALGINQLPASTFLIPIAAAAGNSTPAAVVSTPGDNNNVSVTALDEPLVVSKSSVLGSTTATIAATSRLGVSVTEQQQSQQSQQQPSILLNKLSQSSDSQVGDEPRLFRQSQDITRGKSLLIVEKIPGQSVGQRRWSADRVIGKSKPEVSVINYEWSGRSTNGPESQQSKHSIFKSNNYVTVEVICNNDDNTTELANEKSPDCVYISEVSSGLSDNVDLESPRAENTKDREPEVLNVSSGSSGTYPSDSDEKPGEPEHLDITTESNESTAGTTAAPITDGDDRNGDDEDDGEDDDDDDNDNIIDPDDNFFNSIFPGKYGYKIDIVDVDSCSSSNSESPANASKRRGNESQSEQQQQQQQRKHVKLEEAHLSAPPRAELTVNESETKVDDRDMEVEESSSDRLTTVPDNKSDDAATTQDDRDGNKNDRKKKGQESPSSVGESSPRDEPASMRVNDHDCEMKENSTD